MRISIIIPCYNHAHFLADAIDSALSQSWRDCEVIVVDDGSTDETVAVAGRYAGVRLVRQIHAGVSATRNTGLRFSTGDILIFLDADDRLWPDAAQHAIDAFRAQPAAAMVFGRCRLVNHAGVPRRTQPQAPRAHSYDELLQDNCIWTPAMVAFRRAALDIVGYFDVDNSPAADYDLYLRVSRDFPVVSHDATVVDYRQHAHNMSRDPVLMLEATLKVLRAHRPDAQLNRHRATAYGQAMARWRACYGERLVDRFRGALREGRFRDALGDAGQLLRLYPAGVRYHLQKKLTRMLRADDDPPASLPDVARS